VAWVELFVQHLGSACSEDQIVAMLDLFDESGNGIGIGMHAGKQATVIAKQAIMTIAIMSGMTLSDKLRFVYNCFQPQGRSAMTLAEVGTVVNTALVAWFKAIGCGNPSSIKIGQFVRYVFHPCVQPKLDSQRYAPEERGLQQDEDREWGSHGLITANDFTTYLQANAKPFKALVLNCKRVEQLALRRSKLEHVAAIRIQSFMRQVHGKCLCSMLRMARIKAERAAMTKVATYIQKTWRGMRGKKKARAKFLAIEHARLRLEAGERRAMRVAEEDTRMRWDALEAIVQETLAQERALRLYQSFAGVPKERTLCIIKPDAVRAGHTRAILDVIEEEGFAILMKKRVTMQPLQFDTFYGHFLHRCDAMRCDAMRRE
jgi:hypothetical protein